MRSSVGGSVDRHRIRPMSTIYAYERQPYERSLEVRIVDTGTTEGRPWAELDDTVLFPEGGGQPADHGRLGGIEVVDVVRREGRVHHVLADPAEVGGPTTLELDWRRRFDHMQQHTAQHLLTAIAADRFGWPTTSFHLQAEVCDVEIEAPELGSSDLEALEDAVAAEIRAARPITTRRVEPEALDGLEIRTRGLPAGHTGTVRLVEIEGLDLNTCGGTHLRSTAEIESLKLLGSESRRGGQRLLWIAGGRVRRRLGAHERRNADLRKTLGAGDDELVGLAAAKLEQLKDAQRRLKHLTMRLAKTEGERLAGLALPVVDAHFEDADPGVLQTVARELTQRAPATAALLTAEGPKGRFFLLAVGSESPVDTGTVGPRVAELLEGRGGGKGALFQGKAGSFEHRDEALAAFGS